LGRLTWWGATVNAVHHEAAHARTLTLAVPGWPGHLPGQHVDVRLTAEDGYTATRAYSIAAPPHGDLVQLTVGLTVGGEVSPFLVADAEVGTHLEVRGPIGHWFVWDPADPGPVQLIGGGTGVVPLMAMVRAHGDASSTVPMRLLYSVRDPEQVLYADELVRRGERQEHLAVFLHYTRSAPMGWASAPRRLDKEDLAAVAWPADAEPLIFVCGPTGFVEAISDLLVAAGHPVERIKAERFGPTGGSA
jgi:ferredoxin-NADP reductase